MSIGIRSRDVRYPLGVVGLVLVTFLLRGALDSFVETLAAGSAPWLPMVGTPGQTVLVYSWGVSLFAFVLVPVAAFWLGTQYGRNSE